MIRCRIPDSPTRRPDVALAALLSLTASACCCICFPSGDRVDVDWRLVMVVDSFVPLALALGYFRHLEAKSRGRWAERAIVSEGAYRASPAGVAPVARAPQPVLAAALLALLAWGASINAALDAMLLLGGPEGRGRVGGASLAVAWTAVGAMLVLGTAGGVLGSATLARRAAALLVRRAAVAFLILHSGLAAAILVEWTPLLHALAALMNEPPPAVATFQPSSLTKAAGGAVLAWPVLGFASGLAFWRAGRDL